MALFNKKEKGAASDEKKTAKTSSLSWVIVKPIISEKAMILSGKRVYVFQVSPKANKIQVQQAIAEKYGVHPTKVNILVQKARDFIRRGRKVHTPRVKKAMVTLREGESIELM